MRSALFMWRAALDEALNPVKFRILHRRDVALLVTSALFTSCTHDFDHFRPAAASEGSGLEADAAPPFSTNIAPVASSATNSLKDASASHFDPSDADTSPDGSSSVPSGDAGATRKEDASVTVECAALGEDCEDPKAECQAVCAQAQTMCLAGCTKNKCLRDCRDAADACATACGSE
jgi:hypothetical protein